MVARNEDLPEGELPIRLRPWTAIKVRSETLLAVRDLAARYGQTQAEYIGRTFRFMMWIESLTGEDPLAWLREKFPDSP